MVDKVRIEGIKRCGELARVSLTHASPLEEFFPAFLRTLTRSRINMNLFVGREKEEGIQFTCCVTSAEGRWVGELVDNMTGQRGDAESHHPVDLISIFPHRFNLKVLGMSLMALARAQVPMYGICSSLSALTFITDQTHSDKALAVLKESLALPAEQSGVPC
jgi:aspartokinase